MSIPAAATRGWVLARMETEQSDEGLLKCAGAWVVEERPRDDAQQKGCPEAWIGGAAALDQLLEHSARILRDFI